MLVITECSFTLETRMWHDKNIPSSSHFTVEFSLQSITWNTGSSIRPESCYLLFSFMIFDGKLVKVFFDSENITDNFTELNKSRS